MSLQDDIGNTDTSIEMLRLEVLLQSARVRITPAAAYPALETKVLIAMLQNLEIMMTNQSLNVSRGAPE